MRRKLTKEQFIQKAEQIHGKHHYDYSKFIYVKSIIKSIIICPIHGEFLQTPNSHLSGKGCPSCSRIKNGKARRNTKNDFISKANKKHGKNRYDYSKFVYVNSNIKSIIICHELDENGDEHGEFLQRPNSHLYGRGCPKCYGKFKLTHEQWLKQISKINNKIEFLSTYNHMNEKIKCRCLVCDHIWFNTPAHLKSGQRCPKCTNHIKHTKEKIQQMITKVNPYIKIIGEYVNDGTHIEYKCLKCKRFHTATPSNLKKGFGCPYCKMSKGELKIEKWLTKNKIKFEIQKRFPKCKNKTLLPFDFYLPEYNICIEFDGIQHFEPMRYSKDKRKMKLKFEQCQYRDQIKTLYCQRNNIKLIRIPYYDMENINSILSNELDSQ